MAVTVMTKKRGSPLVTGLVGVSMISCKKSRVPDASGDGDGPAGRPPAPPGTGMDLWARSQCVPGLGTGRRRQLQHPRWLTVHLLL